MQETSQTCKTFSKKNKHLKWHDWQIKHMQSSFVKLDRVKILKCDFCARGFLDPKKFIQHQKTYFQTEMKSDSVDDNDKLEKLHYLNKPFPYTCGCGTGYYKKCDLHSHRRLLQPLLKPVQTTAPKAKTETVVKYKLEDRVEFESKPGQGDGDDKNYKPHSKIGPRLRASLHKQSKSEPNNSSKNKKVKRHDTIFVVETDKPGKCICSICDKTYAHRSSLNEHMSVHTGMPYKCDECPKKFTRKFPLYMHKLKHAGIKNFECHKCNRKLATKESLVVHQRTHSGEKPYACNVCSKTFSQSGARNLHLLKHKGEKNFKCDFCDKSFFDKNARARHTRGHTGEKPYSCKYCGKCFADPSAYKRHELIHTGLKPHQCKLCPKAFCDYSALLVHTRRHQGWSVQCTVCNKSFRSRSQMLNHVKISHKTIKEQDKYECDYCAKRFMLKPYLVTHIVNGHLKTIPKVECEICGNKFNRNKLNIHIRNAHVRKIFNHKCDECGDLFSIFSDLKKHKISHKKSRKKNYECDHCHAAFLTKAHVFWHITLTHFDIQCDWCKLIFSTTRQLRQHKSEGCKRCTVCQIPFPTKQTLENHFILNHLPRSERQMYACDYCSKQFSIKGHLQKHIKRVHEEQTFCCDHCNEVFTRRTAILDHIWEKHMVSLYCNVCLKRFFKESDFQEHKRISCKEQPTFLCEICDTTFLTSSLLRAHLSFHGPKSKECYMCGKKYKTKSLLVRHIRSAHMLKRK